MKRVPCISIILENTAGEVSLWLHDNRSPVGNPNHWTLVGGNVEEEEPSEGAAYRMLEQETGLKADL